MMKKIIASLVLSCFGFMTAYAQDDLLNSLDVTNPLPLKEPISATFKGTRIINGHSVENMRKRHLNFLISHRFGKVNDGAYNLWGLDQAVIRLGLEYGLIDKLMVGIGRSSFNKVFDGFLKYKITQQATHGMPVSISFFGSTVYQSQKYFGDDTKYLNNTDRLSYTYQILIARKFSDHFSLQISPTLVHRNLVMMKNDYNNTFACGIAGRYKLTRRVSFNVEYFFLTPNTKSEGTTNNLSFGFDIETGGHVFQLHFSNSRGMIEKSFITETTGQWNKGDIFYGFNISRTFSFK